MATLRDSGSMPIQLLGYIHVLCGCFTTRIVFAGDRG